MFLRYSHYRRKQCEKEKLQCCQTFMYCFLDFGLISYKILSTYVHPDSYLSLVAEDWKI